MRERRAYTDESGKKHYDMDKNGNMKKGSGKVITTAELRRLANGEVEYDRKYKLAGYKNFHGLKLAIENPKGTYRRGTSPTDRDWETPL